MPLSIVNIDQNAHGVYNTPITTLEIKNNEKNNHSGNHLDAYRLQYYTRLHEERRSWSG